MTRPRDAQGRFTSPTSIVKVTDKRSITASVSDVPEERIAAFRSSSEGKGMRAWKLWRILGVLHYPTSFMAEQVMRLDWDVSVDGRELEPEQAAEAVAAVTSPEGTREIARRLALNLEVAGEVYYIRKSDEWATVSAAAPKLKERLEGADIAIRGWLADPVEPEMADSPVFSSLDVAEELRVMAALSRSQTRNRLAQRGILLRPKEWTFPDGDDFTARFRETTTAPIADEYSAAAVTPLDIAGPAEYIDKWKHLVLDFPYDDKLDQRIDNAIKRLALSLNMPPEVLLGNMTASHWNAWLSDEQTYRSHVQPLAYQVAQIFARAMMKAAPSSGLIVVTPDPSELLARRSSVADAFEAAKLGAVGLEYVRKAMGADEDDAPTPEDLAIILALLGHASEPQMGIEQRPAAPPMPRSTPNGNGQPAIAAAVSEDDAALDELGDRLADIDQNLLLRLQGAADMLASQVRSRVAADEIGVQDAIASEVERLSTTWGRMVDEGRRALRGLGIDAEGQEWEQAKAASQGLLEVGMTAWLVDTMERNDSEMPALPTDLLWQALATAGGSDTAVTAALVAPRGILPQPTPADPRGFAVGVLSNKSLQQQGLKFRQWRWRYGTAVRQRPFHWHREQDGRFADLDGVVAGFWPQDHRGSVVAGTTLCGPEPLAASLRWYEGAVVKLTTASGKLLATTPDHPILTGRGWVDAHRVVEGDDLMRCIDHERAPGLVPDDDHRPTRAEDVFEALWRSPEMVAACVPVAPEDFHGNGEGSEIAVVLTHRNLWLHGHLESGEPGGEQQLRSALVTPGLLASASGPFEGLGGVGPATLRFEGEGRQTATLLRGAPGGEQELSFPRGSWLDASAAQTLDDGVPRTSEELGESLDRFAGVVEPDEVVHVEVEAGFAGHVFDLHTAPRWYIANGLVVHNCLCGLAPVYRRSIAVEED